MKGVITMDESKYYSYGEESKPIEEEKGFWKEHPEAAMSFFLGGLTVVGILATIASIELLGWVVSRKVVKKLEAGHARG